MKTTLNYYRFDISKSDEKSAYNELAKSLTDKGLILFDSISKGYSEFYKKHIQPLNGQVIELETKHLFNNQWNTGPTETSKDGLRVFDWAEAIYPNASIKEGMYLEQTEEMKEIRQNTCSCGYCGAQYYKPAFTYCNKCLGSEYLKEDNLYLLELRPISENRHASNKPKTIPAELLNNYHEKQQISRLERLKKAQESKLQDIKDKITSAIIEYDAFKMLIENDIDFNNVIYYTHTKTFCFGWRDSISKPEQLKLNLKLTNIGFTAKYQIEFK